MNVLITGANGFLGTWLTQRLASRGDRVRCVVRKGSDRFGLDPSQCEIVDGDITDRDSLDRAMKGIEVVFHLAGIRRAPDRESFQRVNVEGTRHVCEAAKAAGVRRLVNVSSLAASGPAPKDQPRVESDPFSPYEWYGESKGDAEKLALTYSGSLEVTSIRPPRITGPKDKENLVFFKIVKNRWKLVVGGPPRYLSTVDVDDAVDLMIELAQRPEAVGEAFFVAGPDLTTIVGLQEIVADALGVKPRSLYLPAPVLRGLGSIADVVSKSTGRHLPLNRKLARQLLAPGWVCSAEKAKTVLGWKPRYTLEQSLRRSADWYRQNGWL